MLFRIYSHKGHIPLNLCDTCISISKSAVSKVPPDKTIQMQVVDSESEAIRPQSTTSAWQSAKQNPRVILFGLGACVSATLWGFDIAESPLASTAVAAVVVAIPEFKVVFGYEYEGELLISATWNSLWTAMAFLGMSIGSIVCGWLSDKAGRRPGFLVGCLSSIFGIGLQYAASRPAMLLAGKLINGFALGFFLTLTSTYNSEISPLPLRPVLTAAINFFMNAGQMAAMAVGLTRINILDSSSYKVTFASQWSFPCAILLFILILPESPHFLVRKSKYDAARASIQRLYGKSARTATILEEIKIAVKRKRQIAHFQRGEGYIACLKGSNFRRTRIACGMFLVQQVAGIAFYTQSLYFLGICGLDVELTFKLATASFGIALIGNILSSFLMSYIGIITYRTSHRTPPPPLTGTILNSTLLLSTGVAGCFHTHISLLFLAYTMNFAIGVHAPTIGAVCWSVCSEISSLELRSHTQGLAMVVNAVVSWSLSFGTPYLINTDEANLGGKAAFIWFGLCVLSFIWIWPEVPETKGRTAEDLDRLFEAKVPAWRF
ncbi:hypothetical protein N7532_011134 [Penicillium argentinense]|uniref:Major facilitator superfamily (MFS) profile domain-containing protein n=1 Tax=Penicillium argentinense TaxID=1131581 RepID=A0A9W9EI07_9EURO|nr:uncharacterized protein N7532_011134 [Penicillium argentinense]KAJ5082091.1 hypothetical protein N7532_011134 [Penicillium argentinense]